MAGPGVKGRHRRLVAIPPGLEKHCRSPAFRRFLARGRAGGWEERLGRLSLAEQDERMPPPLSGFGLVSHIGETKHRIPKSKRRQVKQRGDTTLPFKRKSGTIRKWQASTTLISSLDSASVPVLTGCAPKWSRLRRSLAHGSDADEIHRQFPLTLGQLTAFGI